MNLCLVVVYIGLIVFIVTIVYNTKYLIGIYKHTFQILHMFIRRILKMMCVINCLLIFPLIFSDAPGWGIVKF